MFDDLFPFILFAFVTCITPGPNNMLLLNSGLNYGIVRTIPHYLGVIIGLALIVFIIALGGGIVFDHYPELTTILKYLGSAFMLYIAWKIFHAHKVKHGKKIKKPMTFWQAVLFQ